MREDRDNISKVVFVLLLLGVMLLSAAPYIFVCQYSFVTWDDNVYVFARPEIQNGLTWSGIRWAFTTFENGNYHPLTWLSYMTEIHFFGVDSSVMHATNLLLHLLTTAIVGIVVVNLTGRTTFALWVALFFGVHPQHVENVAWISERKELLGAAFGLLSMNQWCLWRKSRRAHNWYLAHICFLLSLLAKQMLMTMPFLLIVLAVCPLKEAEHAIRWKDIHRSSGEVWLYFILIALFAFLAFLAQADENAIVSWKVLTFKYRLMNAVQSYVFYIWQTFAPIDLRPFYRHPLADVSLSWTLVCLGFAAAVLALAYRLRHSPGVIAGVLWYFGTLVPVIGLVQLGSAARADRYTYIPHIGLFLALGSIPAVRRLCHAKQSMVVLAALVSVLAVLCYRQAETWRNGIELWSSCLRSDPQNFRAYDLLALELLAAERIPEALHYASIAVTFPENQGTGSSFTTLGIAQLISGRVPEAIANLRLAIQLSPHDFRALNNLGYAVHDTDPAEAKRLFREALKYHPLNIEALGNLANCEAEEGNLNAAIELLERALKLQPANRQVQQNLTIFREARKLQ